MTMSQTVPFLGTDQVDAGPERMGLHAAGKLT